MTAQPSTLHPVADTTTAPFAAQPVDVLAAFQGNIERVRAPLPYRLGILLVAIVMVILPLIYVAVALLAAYLVFLHTVNDTWILATVTGRAWIMALIVYLAPIVIGGILVLFMFKPIFSRPAQGPANHVVSREDEPQLYAFVERVCQAVGAPRPKQIELDSNVNASASFRRGLLSMLGNDLVLTVGMPLVAGLSLREFAGVLAHEFGHFAQGAGMRLTYVIRSINHWFLRVVYERDEWDLRLVRWSKTLDFRLAWIFYLARGFVWLTRKLLWLLMMVGNAVSGFMLRQMEFDADRHNVRLVGNEAFESTMHKITVLSIAARGAYSDLDDFYREGRLGDNLPQLILHNVNQFTPDVHGQIDAMLANERTGAFDTHPSTPDRIARARREATAGVFHLDKPATVLFGNFDERCRSVTWNFYSGVFGHELRREEVHAVDQLLARQSAEQESYKALRRYMQGTFRGDRPLPLAAWTLPPADPLSANAAMEPVCAARAYIVEHTAAYLAACEKNTKTLTPAEQREVDEILASFEQMMGQRLRTAVDMLWSSSIVDTVPAAQAWQAESERLLPVLRFLNGQLDRCQEIATAVYLLMTNLQVLAKQNNSEAAVMAFLGQRDDIVGLLGRTQQELDAITYPYEHAKGDITLAAYALPNLPHPDDFQGIFNSGNHVIELIVRLRARITGQYCQMAEAVETVLGLEPLPEPPQEAEETPTA